MKLQFTYQVAKAPDLEALVARSSEKIDRLLRVFDPDLVALHGRLSLRNPREGVICNLNLRLPTGQLASEETAATAQAALRAARADLIEQIKKHKEKLRRESGQRRSLRALPEEVAPPPVAAGLSPLDLSHFISAHVESQLEFIRRQIHWRVESGELSAGELDEREVLNEAIANGLSNHAYLDESNRERWFFLLSMDAIRRLSAEGRNGDASGVELLSLERDLNASERSQAELFETIEPEDELRQSDLIPDPSVASPEDVAYTDEDMTLLEAALLRLPPQQREDLVLFTFEGFSLRELALLSEREASEVEASLKRARQLLEASQEIPGDLRKMVVERTCRKLQVA